MTIATRPVPGPARPYRFPKFEKRELSNGLTVIVATVTKLPLVSVATVIAASAVDDEPGKEGCAELTAQALREGTDEQDGATLTLELERLGTSLETGADWDSTVAGMTVLKDRLPEAFGMLAKVLRHPAFRESDIERLKAERLAERLQIMDEPRGLADESFSRFVYSAGARYAAPMSGSSSSVSAIDREDVADFHAGHYAPSGVTLILAGDISLEEGVALAESAFGSWRGDLSRGISSADTEQRIARAVEIVSRPDSPQSELRIGHKGVARNHPDYFPIVVMNSILGGLFSSRINLNLREVHGYTYGASSYYDWRRQAGPFVIATAVQSEVTAPAIAETLKEVDRMRTEKVSEGELTLATSYLEGVFPIRYETTSAIASALATMVTFGLPDDYFDTYRSNIAAVTTGDVLNAARAHVDPDRLQVVIVGNPNLIREEVAALGLGNLSVREVTEA